MLTRAEIERTLQAYFADKPVKRAWLFGSWARGEADEQSDIDVLVDIDYDIPSSHFDLFGFRPELEEELKCHVDVVPSDWVKKNIQPFIEHDKVLVYERK
jgi:uncharacterized protein